MLRRKHRLARVDSPDGITYREDLDTMQCPHGCDHPIIITSSCHPRAGLQIAYDKTSGLLITICAECEAPVGHLKLASRNAMDVPARVM